MQPALSRCNENRRFAEGMPPVFIFPGLLHIHHDDYQKKNQNHSNYERRQVPFLLHLFRFVHDDYF